ncbi:MAG: lamin tail domain-containing protein, partial [Chloroflexi bacterium]|nr:lamin tail domain-containing protein [Chloroflexota bacterium]
MAKRAIAAALCLSVLALLLRAFRPADADEVSRVHLALVYAQVTPTPTLTPTPTPTLTPTPRENSLRISALRYEDADEYVEITNAGPRAQDMYRWRLVSVVGDQEYTFPWGIELAVGASVRVHSGPGA